MIEEICGFDKSNPYIKIDRRNACPMGINGFDESNPYRKFVKGLVLKRYC